MVKVADRDPVDLGLKVTLMVQVLPAASELAQLFVWLKSEELAPENLNELIASGPTP